MSRYLIAILRGITPDEVVAVTQSLLDCGIDKIEVPLNSPNAFNSIERLCRAFKGQGQFGAGTVLSVEEVSRLAAIGADMVVSPNCDIAVIQATKAAGMCAYPGVMTPSECFAALKAGADGLKLFPGDLIGPVGLKAMRAVLPAGTLCLAVGGANARNFGSWQAAGADGFGIGSALYQPGDAPEAVAEKAREMITAYDEAFD